MSDRLRLGVMGCASIAWRRMLPAAERTPGVDITAVAGRDPDRTERFAARFSADPMPDYAALLEHPDVEAVYIPLPNALHREWAHRAMRNGKHVLVEKPLTCCYRHSVELVAQARSSRRVLMENMTAPRHAQHKVVERLVADGEIGALRSFSAAYGIPPLPAEDIRYRPELGGGALLDLGIYAVRAAVRFAGPGLSVEGAVLRTDPETGVDTSGAALLRTPDGVDVHLAYGFEHAYTSGYTLWGSAGRITATRTAAPPPELRPELTVERKGETRTIAAPADDQDSATLAAFAAQVRGQESTAGHQAPTLRTARLLDAIRAAARPTAERPERRPR